MSSPKFSIPDEGQVYLARGKLAFVADNTPLGEEYDILSYDAEIEATFISEPSPFTKQFKHNHCCMD